MLRQHSKLKQLVLMFQTKIRDDSPLVKPCIPWWLSDADLFPIQECAFVRTVVNNDLIRCFLQHRYWLNIILNSYSVVTFHFERIKFY